MIPLIRVQRYDSGTYIDPARTWEATFERFKLKADYQQFQPTRYC
jgi:hypothetical protein